MPYLLGLFYWGACRLSKFGVKSKSKSCKLDQSVWGNACYAEFCVVCTLTHHCPFINAETVRNFGAVNGQWVPTREFSHKRESANLHFPYNHDNRIDFASFNFRYLPSIYSPFTRPSETILTNRASMRKANKQAF